jgi:hypothetical protein
MWRREPPKARVQRDVYLIYAPVVAPPELRQIATDWLLEHQPELKDSLVPEAIKRFNVDRKTVLEWLRNAGLDRTGRSVVLAEGRHLVLVPEMVPRVLWYESMHRRLRRSGKRRLWNALRAEVLAEHGNACDYCGAVWEKKQVCHEEWLYDDEQGIVTLTGFAIACQLCNFGLHPGIASAPDVNRREEAERQIRKLNGLSRAELKGLETDLRRQWLQRSRRDEWLIVVDPALRGTAAARAALDAAYPGGQLPVRRRRSESPSVQERHGQHHRASRDASDESRPFGVGKSTARPGKRSAE